ncbi:hypothetical protein AB4Y63_04045 [Leifsonia sp. YAF41]
MLKRILGRVGRAFQWFAAVITQVGGAANGGREADQSARSLYEEKKDYRP